MTHKRLIDKYIELIGTERNKIFKWGYNGNDSILIILLNKKEFVFTYKSKTRWSLETIGMFKENNKI